MQEVHDSRTKIIRLKTAKNPELEKLRESVLSDKVNYSEIVSSLKEQIRSVHAAYLFSPSGRAVLACLCRVVSSTPSSPYFSSWKDLGSCLGLSGHQLGCIEQYKLLEPTEMVLKAYAQNWEATLDQVVAALQSVSRLDAIVAAEQGLINLAKFARQEQIRRTEDTDGVYSIFGKGTSDGILRPEHLPSLVYQLPITLKALSPPAAKSSLLNSEIVSCQEARLQKSCPLEKRKEKKFSKAVMLTFAEDGEQTARRVAALLRKSRGRHLPIGVLLLEEHLDRVLENPEQFISHIFPKMHYIIPILTPGYLERLAGAGDSRSSSCSLDAEYLQYIHDLMCKEYVHKNRCKNKRVRCLIPDSSLQEVLSHRHMELDPVLAVWERESQLELLASRILGIRKKDS